MAIIKVKTKNKVDIDKKPRVYFTCHPDDFEKYFEKVCEDIFNTHDCAIYYTENMSGTITEEDKETDLCRNNLFVVPVTFKLLKTPNRAMDDDIPYALKEHIPILPIMMESGIDEFYSTPDKFGEIQYLNPYSHDFTEISYDEKLKKHLESTLISDEMANRIRSAFDAYIFLSYRKKDRRYANELMHLIHNHPECRDVAIWFDEFLTPGENFKESINKILNDSKLFALLVTPNLLEEHDGKPNFVMGEEYPAARKSGIEIFPAEMEETDKSELQAKFEGLPSCINPRDDETFKSVLLETITRLAIKSNDTPEHNFLIGLAYLDGIDVEVNRERALELITSAAKADLPEAMEKLYKMYSEGIGVRLDYRKAAEWAKAYADYMVAHYGEEHPNTLVSLSNLGVAYSELGDYTKALKLQKKLYGVFCEVSGKNHPLTINLLNNLAVTYGSLGDLHNAIKLKEKVSVLRYNVLGKEHPDTLESLSNLAATYYDLGDYKKAVKLQEKVYGFRCKLLGEEHPDTLTSLNILATSYGSLGDYKKAAEYKKKVYISRCEVLGKEHPSTITSLNNVALSYVDLGEYKKAVIIQEKVYHLSCSILGKEHPDTIVYLNNLASTYGNLGDHKKAMELKKKVYVLFRNLLGEEHPNTLVSLSNLAYAYGCLGEQTKEKELTEKAYNLRSKTLGEEHPDTLMSLNNLATIYYNFADYGKAVKLLEKANGVIRKTLGEEHPFTLTSLNNLASSYGELGDYKSAAELQEKVYTLRCNVLGEEHPDTLGSMNNLISTYIDLDDNDKALEFTEKLYALYCKIHGKDHPETVEVLNIIYMLKE